MSDKPFVFQIRWLLCFLIAAPIQISVGVLAVQPLPGSWVFWLFQPVLGLLTIIAAVRIFVKGNGDA